MIRSYFTCPIVIQILVVFFCYACFSGSCIAEPKVDLDKRVALQLDLESSKVGHVNISSVLQRGRVSSDFDVEKTAILQRAEIASSRFGPIAVAASRVTLRIGKVKVLHKRGWVITNTNVKEVDFFPLRNLVRALGLDKLEPGQYKKVIIRVKSGKIVMNGEEHNLRVAGRSLIIPTNFSVIEGEPLLFIPNVDPMRSFVKLPSDRFILLPIVQLLIPEPIDLPKQGIFRCTLTQPSKLQVNPTEELKTRLDSTNEYTTSGDFILEILDDQTRIAGLTTTARGNATADQPAEVGITVDRAVPQNGSINPSGFVSLDFGIAFTPRESTLLPSTVLISFEGFLFGQKLEGTATGQQPDQETNQLNFGTITWFISCEQKNLDNSVDITLRVEESNSFTLELLDVFVRQGMPPTRPLIGNDLIVSTINEFGKVIETFGTKNPLLRADTTNLATNTFVMTLPFSNGVREVRFEDASGDRLLTVDLIEEITTFCFTRPEDIECVRHANPGVVPEIIFEQTADAIAFRRDQGPQFIVDSNIRNFLLGTDVTSDGSGDAVIAFESIQGDLFVSGIARDGSLRFSRRAVNEGEQANIGCISPKSPVIAQATGGVFAVAWLTGESGQDEEILCKINIRFFNISGNPITEVITVRDGTPGLILTDVDLAIDDNEKAIVVWQEFSFVPVLNRVVAQAVHSDGTSEGGRISVAQGVGRGAPSTPAIAMEPAGRFVIAWSADSFNPGVFGTILVQRYNSNRSKLGGRIFIDTFNNNVNHISVAMAGMFPSDPGNFVVVWDTGNNRVMATVVEFNSGEKITKAFAAKAKDNNFIYSPESDVAQNTAGDFFVTWRQPDLLPSVTTGFDNGDGVMGQLFDAKGTPLDLDFRVSDLDPEIKNETVTFRPSVTWDSDGFTVVWDQGDNGLPGIITPGKVLARRYHARRIPCPTSSCGDVVPLVVNGNPQDKLDIVFLMREGPGSFEIAPDRASFARLAVHTIVNDGWLAHDVLRNNFLRTNIYYIPDKLDKLVAGESDKLSLMTASGSSRPPYDVAMRARIEVGGIASFGTRNGSFRFDQPRVFAHEIGHGLFDLSDERSCTESDNARGVGGFHQNIFETMAQCMAKSVAPKQCFMIPNTKKCKPDEEKDGWFSSDSADDIMNFGETFGPDCQKAIETRFNQLP